ncbi:hypothetical protein OH491_27475 (plasmid) [Termitidicoccus mucosus]|uniref:hypothetical protein n=1 Tax=Termitidicoccus mucosus TaxID=1184151 RepID=UPI0031842611
MRILTAVRDKEKHGYDEEIRYDTSARGRGRKPIIDAVWDLWISGEVVEDMIVATQKTKSWWTQRRMKAREGIGDLFRFSLQKQGAVPLLGEVFRFLHIVFCEIGKCSRYWSRAGELFRFQSRAGSCSRFRGSIPF